MVLHTPRSRFLTVLTPCWGRSLPDDRRHAGDGPGPRIDRSVCHRRPRSIRQRGPGRRARRKSRVRSRASSRHRASVLTLAATSTCTDGGRSPSDWEPRRCSPRRAVVLGRTTRDPNGPSVRTRFTAISPQLSFNFGDSDGWSYLSGGLGTSRMSVFVDDGDEPEQRRAGTLNYGGGARWFVKPRLAFSFDLRFFAISPLDQTDTEPASPRLTRMAFSVGVSIK